MLSEKHENDWILAGDRIRTIWSDNEVSEVITLDESSLDSDPYSGTTKIQACDAYIQHPDYVDWSSDCGLEGVIESDNIYSIVWESLGASSEVLAEWRFSLENDRFMAM